MSRYNDLLQKQFKDMGFTNYAEMLKTAVHIEELVILGCIEEVGISATAVNLKTEFDFVVAYSDGERPYYIDFVMTTLTQEEDGKKKKISEIPYWYETGKFPSKTEMIENLLQCVPQY